MRNGKSVGIAFLLVASGLVYFAFANRESLEEFRSGRRVDEVITLRRRPSPGPGLLSVLSANRGPSPKPTPFTSPRAEIRVVEGTLAEDPCAFLEGLDGASNEKLVGFLEESWPRDGSLPLFSALARGDWSEVAEIGGRSSSRASEELALLARTNLFQRGKDSAAGMVAWVGAADPRDLDSIRVMKIRDPENSFWPLLEAHLRERDGDTRDRAELLAEAASLPGFRNPVSSFYSEIQKEALSGSDDRKYLAFSAIRSRAPELSDGFFDSLMREAGRSKENDEMLKWIGKTIENAQFSGGAVAEGESRIDGLQGSAEEAVAGRMLDEVAGGMTDARESRALQVLRKFSQPEDLKEILARDRPCEVDRVHSYFEGIRARVEKTE